MAKKKSAKRKAPKKSEKPVITPAVSRGACAAATVRQRRGTARSERAAQREADAECKATEKDKVAFGHVGGVSNATTHHGYIMVRGKLMKA